MNFVIRQFWNGLILGAYLAAMWKVWQLPMKPQIVGTFIVLGLAIGAALIVEYQFRFRAGGTVRKGRSRTGSRPGI